MQVQLRSGRPQGSPPQGNGNLFAFQVFPESKDAQNIETGGYDPEGKTQQDKKFVHTLTSMKVRRLFGDLPTERITGIGAKGDIQDRIVPYK